MNKEPAALIGAIGTAVAAVVTLLVAFGVDLTPEQQAAILGVFATVAPIVVALLIRPNVASPDYVRETRAAFAEAGGTFAAAEPAPAEARKEGKDGVAAGKPSALVAERPVWPRR